VLAGESVTGVEKDNARITLSTDKNRKLTVDGVVAGLGIEPNIRIATHAGIETDNGIKVNKFLCTNQPDIYAAGDVASFFNHSIWKHMRVEHEDNANMMGLQAGRNMAGKPEPYHHLPFFYSDLFDLGYEAAGILDSRLEVCSNCKDSKSRGDICYMENRRICGILMWNVFGKVETARKLISLVRFKS
jgi:3-phenylpropionate/trans-cinnamate dioxygenase ferredoxin reductase subunit